MDNAALAYLGGDNLYGSPVPNEKHSEPHQLQTYQFYAFSSTHQSHLQELDSLQFFQE